ncbi:hypothetical protein D6C85_07416 [Aureobasidium pullulans]|uniref:C2H2-type domain-containing protein n=1 Tax=Aureobasidium pullulans TaxID=5580 RepID=A0A4S9WT54_AURPU|nr:hypothetical protein D6C85_07416 [Aureobasidium pullulans]
MDFDDQLIAQLNAPEHRTPTPPPPPQDATTTSTPPTNPTTTPSLPRPTMTAKDGESYYIKPIPSGLRAPSLSSLMQLCHTHTLHHGFDVVKKAGVKPTSSKNGKKTIIPNAAYYKWHITCVLGGKPKNTRHLTEEQRRRDKGSLKMGCPSRVWAWAVERGEPDGAWEIRWGDMDPALHNHPPVDVRTLPNHRRRAREVDGVAEAIKQIAASGVGRKEGLQKLRSLYPDGLFSEKDVANELQKHFNEMHANDAKRLREQLALDLYPLPNNTTPEQVFDCRICHQGFTRLYSLLRHQRSDHAALAAGLELELSEGHFNSQFPRQPISQQAIPQFVQPQYIPRFSQPPYGRAARSVDVAEDVAMTPTVDVSFAELQLVTPQPSRVSNRELANSHLRDEDANRLFLDSRYVAPQAHAKLTVPSSVTLPIAINNDDAEDLALTPDMDVSFEDLRAVTPQRTVPSMNKPTSLKLVTKSVEVAETRDLLMTNKLPRVIVRFSAPSPVDHRATPARKNGKAPAAKSTPSSRQVPYQSYSDKCAANIAAANKQTAAEKDQRSLRNATSAARISPTPSHFHHHRHHEDSKTHSHPINKAQTLQMRRPPLRPRIRQCKPTLQPHPTFTLPGQ